MRRTSLIAAAFAMLGALAVPTAGAWAQAAPPVVIDGTPYVLPAGAANNVDAVKVLIASTDAMGMLRGVVRTLGGATHSFQYKATGTVGGQNASVVVGFDYRLPAIRMDVTYADKTRQITVASGNLSWDESKPGVFSQAGKTTAADRLMPLWLLPPAVVLEGAAGAATLKVATVNGAKQITIPLPRYMTQLVATLDTKGNVTHTEMNVGGKLYSADLSNYQDDKLDFHVYFPHRIVEKVDGNAVADLTLSEHTVGPYLVWPIPQQIQPTATK
jgi:hypothetical protein